MKKSFILVTLAAALMAGSALAGPAVARDRAERVELPANQVAAQSDAHTARIKADLRLTPEQEKNWAGFETAWRELGQKRADREVAFRTAKKDQGDFIEFLRRDAVALGERAEERKKLADAAQPLYASLDERQQDRLAKEVMRLDQ